ncbi:hypothetical protein BOTBODRAFT_406545 [Botryobasidium botryosum FD-172 SS1]|uniref:Protein kinase domain-containing protein n=1 Tax=Botryobasidium botryosum (strain FD-172 SS1) TaxID=930990 RepID=A0A067MB26_BOTB1|nr:hypothetical protein BOTBODRAFT_406545 [Botryobasidium botryosum FD-172 SS1]
MYNLEPEIDDLKAQLREADWKLLREVRNAAADVPDFTQAREDGASHTAASSRASTPTGLESILEWRGPIFDNDDICAILDKMGFEIILVFRTRPHIASMAYDQGNKKGVLKYVTSGKQHEIDILQHLLRLEPPANCIIRPLGIWPVYGGTLVAMPMGGHRLNMFEGLEPNLLSIMHQLLEGVALLHEHGVAHMDLKPENILVRPESIRLSIIDFSVSELVDSPDVMCQGFSGTKGWAAPEVGPKPYSPILADLWSCGRVVHAMCEDLQVSAARDFLLGISGQLMDPVPGQRPAAATAMRSVSEFMEATQ